MKKKKDEYTVEEIQWCLNFYEKNLTNLDFESVEKMEDLNNLISCMMRKIESEEFKEKINELIQLNSKIIKSSQSKNVMFKKIKTFMDYYLPSIIKLLIKYDEIENLKLNTTKSKEFMSKVSEYVGQMIEPMKKLCESLYEDIFWDVEAELKVMHLLLIEDGFIKGLI